MCKGFAHLLAHIFSQGNGKAGDTLSLNIFHNKRSKDSLGPSPLEQRMDSHEPFDLRVIFSLLLTFLGVYLCMSSH